MSQKAMRVSRRSLWRVPQDPTQPGPQPGCPIWLCLHPLFLFILSGGLPQSPTWLPEVPSLTFTTVMLHLQLEWSACVLNIQVRGS